MSTVGTRADEQSLPPLQPPGDSTGLFGVFRRRYLLKLLVQKELRVRYQASFLGLLWSYIKPLIRFLTYLIVIGYVIGLKDLEGYPYHIFSGMIIVTAFSETLRAGTRSVTKNKSLVRKMNVPREMFPMASVLVTAYHVVPQFVVLLIAVWLAGWHPDGPALVAGVLSVAILVTFSLAVALAFSAFNVYYRDSENFTETIAHLVTWSTPMIYTFEMIADRTNGNWIEQVYLLNPVAIAVMLSQRCFWVPTLEDPATGVQPDNLQLRGVLMLVACLAFVWLAQRIFSRLESGFAEHL
ncbi:MAG: ABC transporter permease [Nocardioidaceae bacterium]|nr:ABC transporter permease [Nocardioidaceae bacterium]MDQ3164705.1 ABC transporter permease [Actinomycetota bacterium]